jgi:hypothetical protein
VPPLPAPVTTMYLCAALPNYHCAEAPSGNFHTPTDCEKVCHHPTAPA